MLEATPNIDQISKVQQPQASQTPQTKDSSGAVSSGLATSMTQARSRFPAANQSRHEKAVIRHAPSGPEAVADNLRGYADAWEAQSNHPIDLEAGKELLAHASRHREIKNKTWFDTLVHNKERADSLKDLYQRYQDVEGVSDPQLKSSSKAAGGEKYRMNIETDCYSLLSSFVTQVMKWASVAPKAIGPTGAAIQASVTLLSPYRATDNMVDMLPRQVLLREFVPAGFGGSGNLWDSSVEAARATWQVLRDPKGGDVDGLREKLEKLEANHTQHTSRYLGAGFENASRIGRNAFNVGGAHATQRWIDYPKVPINLGFQIGGLAFHWTYSANVGGPNQEYQLVKKGIDFDMLFSLPKIAQALVERKTGTRLDIGDPQLAAKVEELGLDDEAVSSLQKLVKRRMHLAVQLATGIVSSHIADALDPVPRMLGLRPEQILMRQELQAKNRTPLPRPSASQAQADPALSPPQLKQREESYVLHELNTAYATAKAALTEPQRARLDDIEEKVTQCQQDIKRLGQGPDGWVQMDEHFQKIMSAVLGADSRDAQIAIGKLVGDSVRAKAFTEWWPHGIQKYAKSGQGGFILSSGFLQIINNLATARRADGNPMDPKLLRDIINGHFAGNLVSEIAGGAPLVGDKNTTRGVWRKDFPHEPPTGIKKGWMISKEMFLQSLVMATEFVFRLPLAEGVRVAGPYVLQRAIKANADDPELGIKLGPTSMPTESTTPAPRELAEGDDGRLREVPRDGNDSGGRRV